MIGTNEHKLMESERLICLCDCHRIFLWCFSLTTGLTSITNVAIEYIVSALFLFAWMVYEGYSPCYTAKAIFQLVIHTRSLTASLVLFRLWQKVSNRSSKTNVSTCIYLKNRSALREHPPFFSPFLLTPFSFPCLLLLFNLIHHNSGVASVLP